MQKIKNPIKVFLLLIAMIVISNFYSCSQIAMEEWELAEILDGQWEVEYSLAKIHGEFFQVLGRETILEFIEDGSGNCDTFDEVFQCCGNCIQVVYIF